MSFDMPESMDDLVYFTNRKFEKGNITCWVPRGICPKCEKHKMGKPVEDGGVKIRAKYYECPGCDHKIDKKEYEESLSAFVVYACPHCSAKGEQKVPFKRKKIKGVEALVVICHACKGKFYVTKKMKDIK